MVIFEAQRGQREDYEQGLKVTHQLAKTTKTVCLTAEPNHQLSWVFHSHLVDVHYGFPRFCQSKHYSPEGRAATVQVNTGVYNAVHMMNEVKARTR